MIQVSFLYDNTDVAGTCIDLNSVLHFYEVHTAAIHNQYGNC